MTTRGSRKRFWLFVGILAVATVPAAVYFAPYLNPPSPSQRPMDHAGPDSRNLGSHSVYHCCSG